MSYKLIQAKSISYGGTRPLSSVKYIVLHYTAVKGDTAKANCNYFAHSNMRAAGAHFFADRAGKVYQSIPLNRVAWSVGGLKWNNNGGSLYGVATNYNTVSIEMCDVVDKYPSKKQVKAIKKLVKYIQSQCPNAKKIIRHWDVNGKPCPARMTGNSNAEWNKFKKAISPAAKFKSYKVKITEKACVRQKATSASKKVMTLDVGGVYTIVDEKSKWGKLKSGAGWISLKKTKKV